MRMKNWYSFFSDGKEEEVRVPEGYGKWCEEQWGNTETEVISKSREELITFLLSQIEA